ncbi:uncharacterized protein B0J16DRAFT_312759 [Fusarium flagelliforme]|uniref:Uncharacterized protein n=1 Tax=Fusarium flagelliforme TaxID=2675880 RepID=A0A395MC38_9HYPO|nr:uncharacterized protein B0J16DRAFT_312759 [Fusarium flagelliforme]KAH7196394.1 hypothetical protein B0J16DRAFT_312759 [Fusarium flagelliforme]RFN45425.1 hypothetical protein FIE12Z_10290 [Fusarium flagelliforme]
MVAIKISALALLVSMITLSSATPIDSEAQTLEARARGNAVVYTSVGGACNQVVESQAFQGDNVHICHEVTNIGSLRVEGSGCLVKWWTDRGCKGRGTQVLDSYCQSVQFSSYSVDCPYRSKDRGQQTWPYPV